MVVSNNNFMLLCFESLSMEAKRKMLGFILFISLALTALAKSPPVVDSAECVTQKPPLCPENEERRCQNSCPPETCLTLYAAFLCIQNQTCVDGCYCKKGFLRVGAKGPCVPRDQCNPIECVNDPNAQKGCGDKCGNTCADYQTNPICPKRPCTNDGCQCKEGYIYDQNLLLCVEPKKCTKPCKANERYSTCLPNECVPKTCADVGKPVACPPIRADPCPGGCICNYGYVKDKDGNCIDAKTCPTCNDDPNAQAGCGNPCGKTCANLYANKSDLICPQYCHSNGCDCKEGYLLNTDVKPPRCVLVKDCPKPPNKCGENEEFYCGPSCPDSEASCSTPNPPICINKKCELKCFCKEGFVRDANNACIPSNECPKKCNKPHERYSSCVLGECVAKKCEDLGKSLPCPGILPPCAGGCICEEGYVRDKDGNCIDAKTCPSCDGDPNAVTGCGNPCGRTCANLRTNTRNKRDTSAVACATYCKVNGCDCKKGYILNTDVNPPRCVLPEDCDKPINCTKPNERYINCIAGQCGPKYCDDLERSISCPSRGGPCPGGCICEEGYLRDSNGNCIKLEKCPAKPCGENQTWISPCNAPCPYQRCPRDDKPPPPCAEIKPCYPGCQCKLNYLRNSTGHCILAPECPRVKCTRQNETWDGCPSSCLAEDCDDVDRQPTTCNTLIWLCSPRCVCKKGHFRNKDGLCIPASQCPKQCTKPHERYSICLLGECVPKTCSDVGYPVPCPDIIGPCAGGCTCQEGFVRDSNGDCIDMKKCPYCGGDPNAVSGCGNPCGKTCASLYANKSDLICPQYCEYNGCDCKPGYLLLESNNTDSSKCVPEKKCPKPPPQCGVNEQYYCGTSCPEATCANPTPPTCVNKKCKLGCFCKKGFVRDANNKCIPVGKCPPKCKGPHEIYINCPVAQCNAKTCKHLITPPPCPRVIPPCPGGCVCKDGYLRDSKGICIKKEQCPFACKDPNASWTDCMDACPRTCQNTNPGCVNVKCSAGCQCNAGYVLSKIGGKCVKIEECPEYANCCANQTFVPCTYKCPQVTCPKSDRTLLCKPPRDCPGGCGCKPYYRYNATGDCIKASDCPPVECTGANQVWTSCQRISDWERCEDRYNSPPFNPGDPDDCTPKCVCKKGYWRNDAKECVPEKECPPKCKGPHENYIDCPVGQCYAKTCKDLKTPPPCPRVIPPCPGGCVCDDGYLRDSNGICIKKEQCPSTCKDPNASWTDCMDACPRTCQNTNPGCVNVKCSAGCQCNAGYVLSKIGGKCVKIEECPVYANCCANQTFVPCTHKCPQVRCPESDLILLCKPPRDCPGGCGCKPYYRYNATEDCIKASDCPPVECTGANQVWTSCQRISDWERCEDRYNSPPFNPGDPDDCTPKCVCKKGCWRNDANECVPEKECPSIK